MKRFLASLVLLFCLFGVYANAQKVVVGPSRGYGVDGGATTQTLNTTGAISSGTRNLLLGTYGGTAWTTGTATLPLISGLASTDVCIRIEDGGTAAPGNQISGTATFTLAANTGDSINGGAAAGTIGPFTTGGMSLLACRTAAHNWNVGPGTIAGSSAPANQFANGVTVNGLTYQQPACADLSTAGTGCSAGAASTSTAGIAKLHNVPVSLGWVATVNPNNTVIAVINQASTISAIIGAVETATGTAATVTVNKAPSGTACSAGTALHSGTFNANGTAATNQTLTVTTASLAAGDRLCLQTTGTTSWTGGTGIGTITVFLAPS